MTDTAPASDLTGWRHRPFTAAGITHDCFEKGEGPGVVVLPEVPGIHPEVLGFGDHLVDQGFTVVLVSLYGVPGKAASGGYTASTIARACVSAEFRAFAVNAHRPVTDYLRAVSRDLAGRTPGRGVGVIGMCFSGGFALAAAVDDVVLAPVMSQPSVPFPVGAGRKRDVGLAPDEAARIVERTKNDGLCVLGMRFSEDPVMPRERFASLRELLGDAFEVIELDSSPGNAAGFAKNAHAVITGEVREVPGHPALGARQRVVEFLRERLTAAE
ncbi:dienelactone hydrolase family protein [Umezawaea sp. Da 62-37]|uniref:dienelactone hydrolase family protein n=1 Tax=Umezawaea sp. Da 62-37 TaxID=3075927 RepID=UPI0028F6CBC0|nr:dienelactone hydrolase family protein [Umezawaea sp. Da 62-37]WNV84011.1 dienelactone hydrolase family protein [Umezawaea sp. Da 62-37]